MFSVTRFFMSGASKMYLRGGANLGLLKGNKSEFFKFQLATFGAKSKDQDVDKSKKSVSGGATTSDSEGKREVNKQTVKVGSAGQGAAQPKQEAGTGKTSSNTPTGQTAGNTPSTKDAKTSTSTTSPSATSGSSSSSSSGSKTPSNEPKVKVITSIPGNKPPTTEDTVAGRYAHTLFVVASQEKNLYNVYEDMKYVTALYENLNSFRIFADNSGLNASQIYSFSEELAKCGEFCATTLKFCDLLGKNKRFMYINEIAKKYIRSYLLLTKEEKITIISAQDLTNSERNDVSQALLSNPENAGKTFIIDYQTNPSIIGGLQMYTENKFMDLSLSSRLDKIKDELNKLI